MARAAPTRLVIAPGDIRTADPTRADDIYAGFYMFGGRLVSGEGRPPFEVPPPTPDFTRDLAGFSWLRHMRAAGTALARTNARALITDYLAVEARLRNGPGGEAAVVARRILSWLGASPFLLAGAEADFYHAFMRGLGRDAALLARRYDATVGSDRLLGGIALTELALCADLGAPVLKGAAGLLSDDLVRQVLPDGGHIGRNPETLIDLLLDLLPLRQTFAARQQPVPPALIGAVDRIIPMLRLLRHPDGSLALFNGMGVTEPDHLAAVLAYADPRGRALLNAPHSGYQRLEGGDAALIVDAGAPPSPAASQTAHAGCLSFEFSLGLDRLVVNCGVPATIHPSARQAARQTAAHSTLVIDDTSSCRFAGARGVERLLRGGIVAGPRDVTVQRRETGEATFLDLTHDGYRDPFGVRHARRLALTRDGRAFTGEDRLTPMTGVVATRRPERVAIRFHLHPSVQAAPAEGGGLLLSTPSAAVRFEADGAQISLEESVFFAVPTGAQRGQQIVLSSPADLERSISWSFLRS